VNLFVQGMRRSGTTIVYDALREDSELRCWYEPLREEKVSLGGGSGAREEDAFAETSAERRRFRDRRYPQLAIDDFNWGGPRNPLLELEPSLPEHCIELLRELLDSAPAVAIKETRFYRKVGELHRLDPDAVLVHVVREPRAVAASIMLGRGRRQLRKRYPDADSFFEDRKPRRLWSTYEISQRLVARENQEPADPTNLVRVLMVWRYTFEETRRAGLELFGDRYVLLRNEDLRAQPQAQLERLYAAIGRDVPRPVADWAKANVSPRQHIHAEGDPRWAEALEMAGLTRELLATAGYSEPGAPLG
jgi:hypothetical protein